jgi:uncharacterized protein YggT (Ycf19 family)
MSDAYPPSRPSPPASVFPEASPFPQSPASGYPEQAAQSTPAPRREPEPGPGPTGQDAKLWIVRAAKLVVVFIYVVVLVDLVLLTLGFVLRLFGASTDAEFTRWVYRNVDRVMEPFRGMFPSHAVTDQSVLDSSLLFAMIVYAIVAIALHALVTWLTQRIVLLRHRQAAWQRRGGVGDPMLGA